MKLNFILTKLKIQTSLKVISIIPRQSSELNSKHFRANFFWSSKNQLVIGWGDYVQVCQIKNRAGTRKVEIQKMCKTDFKVTFQKIKKKTEKF